MLYVMDFNVSNAGVQSMVQLLSFMPLSDLVSGDSFFHDSTAGCAFIAIHFSQRGKIFPQGKISPNPKYKGGYTPLTAKHLE
jgi:hypothetical protein